MKNKFKSILENYFLATCTIFFTSFNKEDIKLHHVDEDGEKYKWHFVASYLNDFRVMKLKTGWGLDQPKRLERCKDSQIKYLIIHYTVSNQEKSFSLLCSERGPVSVHYIIDNKGIIYDILDNSLKASHAGVSKWKDDVNLNDYSIGIENINSGYEDFITTKVCRNWYPFNKEQIDSLGKLCKYIVNTYGIKPAFVLAHADIAPNRKEDPGPLFPWWYLYEVYGVGAWCTKEDLESLYDPLEVPQEVNIEFISEKLYDYGYTYIPRSNTDKDNLDYRYALQAFKSHFSKNQRPEECTKEADMEDQIYIYCLCKKYNVKACQYA